MRWLELARRAARLMVGVGDYDTYLRHRAAAHPGEKVMSRGEFYANRAENRFGGVSRCC
jgi:uncharacterized short protein YbdD (DUF466 family)